MITYLVFAFVIGHLTRSTMCWPCYCNFCISGHCNNSNIQDTICYFRRKIIHPTKFVEGTRDACTKKLSIFRSETLILIRPYFP